MVRKVLPIRLIGSGGGHYILRHSSRPINSRVLMNEVARVRPTLRASYRARGGCPACVSKKKK